MTFDGDDDRLELWHDCACRAVLIRDVATGLWCLMDGHEVVVVGPVCLDVKEAKKHALAFAAGSS